MAAPFDPDRLEVTGAPVAIASGVRQSINISGAAFFGFTEMGWLVYVPGTATESKRTIVWVDRNGKEEPVPLPQQGYRHPSLSPDGTRLAISIDQGSHQDVRVYDFARGALSRLTFEGNNQFPTWTPDGEKVVFQSNRTGASNLFWKPGDGSGKLGRLTTSEQAQMPSSWSSDGRFLAFVQVSGLSEATSSFDPDIWILPMDGERTPWPFFQSPFIEAEPHFSPNGRWLAYQSNESGKYEIYVRPFPSGEEAKEQVSTEGGSEPIWSGNGELFYRNGDKMMVVDIKTEPSLSVGTPRLLFEGSFDTMPIPLTNYDVTSDGQRFLMIKTSRRR